MQINTYAREHETSPTRWFLLSIPCVVLSHIFNILNVEIKNKIVYFAQVRGKNEGRETENPRCFSLLLLSRESALHKSTCTCTCSPLQQQQPGVRENIIYTLICGYKGQQKHSDEMCLGGKKRMSTAKKTKKPSNVSICTSSMAPQHWRWRCQSCSSKTTIVCSQSCHSGGNYWLRAGEGTSHVCDSKPLKIIRPYAPTCIPRRLFANTDVCEVLRWRRWPGCLLASTWPTWLCFCSVNRKHRGSGDPPLTRLETGC